MDLAMRGKITRRTNAKNEQIRHIIGRTHFLGSGHIYGGNRFVSASHSVFA